MHKPIFDILGMQLVPGALYVKMHEEVNWEGETITQDGSLVWAGPEGDLYNADYPDTEGEPSDDNADYYVRQQGCYNPSYAA